MREAVVQGRYALRDGLPHLMARDFNRIDGGVFLGDWFDARIGQHLAESVVGEAQIQALVIPLRGDRNRANLRAGGLLSTDRAACLVGGI